MTAPSLHLPKFTVGKSDFDQVLKQKSMAYFTENNISEKGNWKLFFKTIFWVSLLVGTYYVLIIHPPESVLGLIALGFVTGVTFAGIGVNIVHDAAHGGYSDSRTLNIILGYLFNFVGADILFWKIKHNIVHHTYVNINEVDDDIDAEPFLRLSPVQKRLWFHKYQSKYALLLYCFLYLMWVYVKDFQKYFTLKIGRHNIPKFTIVDHIIFWISKAIYTTLYIVIPLYTLGWKGFLFYGVTVAVCGVCISVVFQLAHIVQNVEFPMVNIDTGNVDSNFALHQIATTSDFAPENKLVSWLVGGLNFQVVHHLFPKVSHVHYPALHTILKETCKEFGVTYHYYDTLKEATASHFAHLKDLGKE